MDMNLQALRGTSRPKVVLYQFDQDRDTQSPIDGLSKERNFQYIGTPNLIYIKFLT